MSVAGGLAVDADIVVVMMARDLGGLPWSVAVIAGWDTSRLAEPVLFP